MKYTDKRPTCVWDIECLPNYFLVGFREIGGKQRLTQFERFETEDGKVICVLDRPRIAQILRNWRIVSFNGNHYDLPLLLLAMTDVSCGQLKRASDQIISGGMKPWEFEKEYNLTRWGFIDHIDLIEVAPGRASLKIYTGRLHSKRMQEMPFAHYEPIADEDRPLMKRYNGNDMQGTEDLWVELDQYITLRAQMSDEFGVDVRSKSDAQVAEAIIRKQIEREIGRRIYKPERDYDHNFQYTPAKFVKFKTPEMQAMYRQVCAARFSIDNYSMTAKLEIPAQLKGLKIPIGQGIYRIGNGGLHSSEKRQVFRSNDEYVLWDHDVSSYYPRIILGSGLYPKSCGSLFQKYYRGHFDTRMEAKRAGLKQVANSRKIMLNGTFGKTGSPYSIFYSPELLIYTTITGQMALLMLIESIELAGIQVISANTDGVISNVPRDRVDVFMDVVMDWELATGFETEQTPYTGVYSRDVNNYIALKEDGTPKLIGAFAEVGLKRNPRSGLQKNPANEICVDAVVRYLRDGIPLRDTIEGSTDFRKFISVRKVNGGALFGDEKIGSAIRWYYSSDVYGPLTYVTNGNSVPKSEGARPCLEMPDEMPDDIDFDWYVREAQDMIEKMGMEIPLDNDPNRREGRALGHRPDAKNVHVVDLYTQRALCGEQLKGVHDKWVELESIPEGRRACAKCRKADEI